MRGIDALIDGLDTPGDKAAEKVIRRLVKIGRPAVRKAAAEALAELGRPVTLRRATPR